MSLFPCRRCLVKACCRGRCELLATASGKFAKVIAPIAFATSILLFLMLIYYVIINNYIFIKWTIAIIWIPTWFLTRIILAKLDSKIEFSPLFDLIILMSGPAFLLWLICIVILPNIYNKGVAYHGESL